MPRHNTYIRYFSVYMQCGMHRIVCMNTLHTINTNVTVINARRCYTSICSAVCFNRSYADGIKKRLMSAGVVTEMNILPHGVDVLSALEEATRRRLLFAIVVNDQNEIHRSITVNILHGLTQGTLPFVYTQLRRRVCLIALTVKEFVCAQLRCVRLAALIEDCKKSDSVVDMCKVVELKKILFVAVCLIHLFVRGFVRAVASF